MNNSEKRLLTLVGVTYNQISSGVYALILQEVDGQRRLPIVIGASEAQSIECKLQEIIPPRPLTHDLTVNIMRAYGLGLKGIEIKRIDGGIFAADILLTDGSREISIDSRSSDAIALAIRMGAPIYTTEEVLSAVGIERREKRMNPAVKKIKIRKTSQPSSLEELETMLAEAVEKENYEEAGRLKSEIDKLKAEKENIDNSEETNNA